MWTINDGDVSLIAKELREVSARCEVTWPELEDLVDLCGFVGQARRLLSCGDDPTLKAAFLVGQERRQTLCLECADAFDEVELETLLETLEDAVSDPVPHPRPIFDALIDIDFVLCGATEAGRADVAKRLTDDATFILMAFLHGTAEAAPMAARFMARHGASTLWDLVVEAPAQVDQEKAEIFSGVDNVLVFRRVPRPAPLVPDAQRMAADDRDDALEAELIDQAEDGRWQLVAEASQGQISLVLYGHPGAALPPLCLRVDRVEVRPERGEGEVRYLLTQAEGLEVEVDGRRWSLRWE